jgi:hypothetical protein
VTGARSTTDPGALDDTVETHTDLWSHGPFKIKIFFSRTDAGFTDQAGLPLVGGASSGTAPGVWRYLPGSGAR